MFNTRITSMYADYANSIRSDNARDLEKRREEEENELRVEEPSFPVPVKKLPHNKVDSVHFYIKSNAKRHHTKAFDLVHDSNPKPILRRGQPFYITIRFQDRDFDVKTDRVLLNFRFGPTPSVTKGTMGVIAVTKTSFELPKDDWDVRIDRGTNGRDLMLEVSIPPTAPVGMWKLHVRSGLQDPAAGNDMSVYKAEPDIYILFNPWSKDDSVYMDDDKKRDEYVMNDRGKLYVGNHKRPRGRPWAFGQFDDVVLPVACYILELSRFAHSERGNPVQVVRAIAAGVNDSDDEGIVQGRWDGKYSDGTSPFMWTGSARILEEYMRNGYKPVKYGQCWVFSAVVTTICRALGIPCRSVTNYVSAHDTNSSLTVDKFFDAEHNEIEGGPDGENHDSIWNFHVWNDVWMTRSDLPPGYGGWQAIDSTPQEESDQKMQCGPASLAAVQKGDIGLGYDCSFVFSEVNADIMHWLEDSTSDWGFSRMKLNKVHIGRSIITKKPGVDDDFGDKDADNILTEYKRKEGTEAERNAIYNAIRGSRRAQAYYGYPSNKNEDVEFKLVDIDSLKIGDDFKIKVFFRNTSNEERTVSATLQAKSVYYTGVHHADIKRAEGKVRLRPKEEKDIALTIRYQRYWKKLTEQCMIKMNAICTVEETKQTWADEDDFQVEKPRLDIQGPNNVIRKDPMQLTFSFTNPLDDELTNCKLSIDGSGLLRPRNIKIRKTLEPKEKFTYTFRFRPRVHGKRQIIATFNSDELFDINGTKTFVVSKIN